MKIRNALLGIGSLAIIGASAVACGQQPQTQDGPTAPARQATSQSQFELGQTWQTPAADIAVSVVPGGTHTLSTGATVHDVKVNMHVTNKAAQPLDSSATNLRAYSNGQDWQPSIIAGTKPAILPGKSGDWSTAYVQPDSGAQLQIQVYVSKDGSALVDNASNPANVLQAYYTGTYSQN